MAAGLFILGIGNYWMSRLNLEISPWQIVWPRVVFIMGLSTIFAPLNVAAFINIPPQLRGAAVGLLALLRNEGGSVGTSLAQTIQQRRDQFHSLRLGENLDPLNPAVNSYVNQAQPVFLQQTGDPVAANQMALQSLANLREQQSSSLAYFDVFFIFAVVAFALIVLVFFMKRSVAVKDAHLAAE
jgi:DHA2 family multidrug resistance protein